MKRLIALLMALVLCLLLCACGKSDAVKATEEAISQIGEVTYSSDEKITAAEELFNNLTDRKKETVENASELTAARNAYLTMITAAVNKHSDEMEAITAAVKEADFATAHELLQAVRDEFDTMDPALYEIIASVGTDDDGNDPRTLLDMWDESIETFCVPGTYVALPERVLMLEPHISWCSEDFSPPYLTYFWSTTYGISENTSSYDAYQISVKVHKQAFEDYRTYLSKYGNIIDCDDDQFIFEGNCGEHFDVRVAYTEAGCALYFRVE